MNWQLLMELCDTPGIPGDEVRIADIFRREIAHVTSEIHTDSLGNVYAHIAGAGPKVMFDAHMDEVGFLVRHIDDNGFVRVIPMGGIESKSFISQRLTILGAAQVAAVVGATPPHLSSGSGEISIEDCFLDTGLPVEKVKSLVHLGDCVTFDSKCIENEFSVTGKAFDDRVGIFIMIEAAKAAKRIGCDLYLVAAVQEEGGMRGAGPAAFSVQPDLAISLEGTVANDIPGAGDFKRLACLGKGPEIRLTDKTFTADRALSFFIIDLAAQHNVKHQVMVKKAGGTNASAIQIAGRGTRSAAISVPVRYIHSPQCVVRKEDIENAVLLVKTIIENADKFAPQG